MRLLDRTFSTMYHGNQVCAPHNEGCTSKLAVVAVRRGRAAVRCGGKGGGGVFRDAYYPGHLLENFGFASECLSE